MHEHTHMSECWCAFICICCQCVRLFNFYSFLAAVMCERNDLVRGNFVGCVFCFVFVLFIVPTFSHTLARKFAFTNTQTYWQQSVASTRCVLQTLEAFQLLYKCCTCICVCTCDGLLRLIVPRMQHSTLETTTTKAVLPRAPRHSQPRCALLAALNAATCAHRQPHSSTRISWGGGRLHSNPVSKICFLFFFPISFQLFSFSFSFILLFSFLFLLLFAVLYCIVMSPLSLPRAAFQPMLAGTLRQATLAYEWLSLQFGGCSFTVKLVAVARVTRYNGFAKLEAAIKSDTICDIFWVALWHLIETARHSRQSRAQQQDSNLSNWIM